VRLERRKVGREAVDVELVEVLGSIDVLEPVRAEIADRDALHRVLDQLTSRSREHHLTAVRNRSDPRRAVHSEPDVPLLAHQRLARVQAHSHAYLTALRPVVYCKRTLRANGSAERRARTREREEERVSLRVDLASAALVDGLAEDPPVRVENVRVAISEPPQEPRRALDVREQERDRPARQLGHELRLRPPSGIVKPFDPGRAVNRRRSRTGTPCGGSRSRST
jgi:hypothetical protein